MTLTGPQPSGDNPPTAVIDAQKLGRVFNITSGVTVTLKYLLIQNGDATTALNGPRGGGIYNNGTLILTNSILFNNTADENGAGIQNFATLNVVDSNLYNNTARFLGGGAISNYGSLNVSNSNIYYNHAQYGGGIWNYYGNLTVNNSKLYNNTAVSWGGGIRNYFGNLTVNSSNIFNNTANYGGGIDNPNGNVTVTDSNVYQNKATLYGGGLKNYYGNMTINGSNIYNNTSQTGGTEGGGGIQNYGSLTVTGSNIYDNNAVLGGGICSSGGTVNITFSRILGNIAPTGSAINCVSGSVNATLNWWGSNNNPASKVNGNVNVTPWMVLNITANPTTVLTGMTSNITADIVHDSNGVYHDPAIGYVPNELPVSFATTLGTINSPLSTHFGTANATLNGGAIVGVATVNATVDNQTVNTTVTIISVADIYVIENATPNPVIPGQDILTFNILIENNGPCTALNVTLNDNSADLSKMDNIHYSLDNLSWYDWPGTILLGNIASGATQTVWIRGPVNDDAVGIINNTVNVTTSSNDTVLGNNTANTIVVINNVADVSITKSASPNPAITDNLLTFTLFVKNYGPAVAREVTVNDNSPDLSKFSNIEYSLNGSSWSAWTGSYLIGDMAPNTNQTIWIRGNVTNSAQGTINNTANVTTTNNDTDLDNNMANAVTEIISLADVSITKSASPNPVIPGSILTFTLFVKNSGPSFANAVTVNDNSADLSKLSNIEYSLDGSSWSAWTGSYLIGDIAPNANQTIWIRGTVNSNASGNINNTANVTTTTNDTSLGNNTANTVTTINAVVDVSITKSASPNPVIAGQDTLIFTLFVKNNGPSVARTVTVNDNSADFSKLNNMQYSLDNSSWNTWNGSYLIGDMTPNANQTIWIRGNVNSNATGSIENTANVTTTSNDTTLSNNEANVLVVIFQSDQAMVLNTRTLLTYSKIQDAIDAASTLDGDTLYCNSGTYNEHDILVYKDLVIIGPEITGNNLASVVVDGQKLGRVFNITSDSTVTLQYLLVQNGNASTDISNPNGGGVYNEGLLNIVKCIFRNNTAEYWGGAIQNMGTLDVSSGSYFTNNSAEEGGAIYNKALIEVGFDGLLTVSDSIFINNTAASNGGAVYNSEGAVTMHYNRIFDNSPNAICTSVKVDVEDNWWGSNADPSALFAGSGTVNYSPWIYMTFTVNQSSIPVGSSSILTASFNNAFNGNNVTSFDPAGGHIPDGLDVVFSSDSLGSVNPLISKTLSGIATTIYIAGILPGNSTVNATFDSQMVGAIITIIQPVINIVSVDPASETINVPINKVITLSFDDIIQAGSTYANIRLKYPNGSGKPITTSINGNTLTITPNTNLAPNTTFTVYIPINSIANSVGSTISAPFTSNFTTVTSALAISNLNPANGTVNVPVNQVITITFSEPITAGSAYSNIRLKYPNGSGKPITNTINGNTLTITPNTNLAPNTTFTIYIPVNAIINGAGMSIASTYTSKFTTAITVTNVNPTNGAVNVPVNQIITITFSEPITAGSAYTNIRLKYPNGSGKPITTSISGNTLTITPNTNLALGTTFTIYIPVNAIINSAGASIATTYTSTFTTINSTLSVTNVNPANGAINVPVNQVITITFSEPITAGSAYTNIRLKYPNGSGKPITTSISGNTLTITPNTNLALGTTFTIYIPVNAITNSNGETLTATYTSKFTTTS